MANNVRVIPATLTRFSSKPITETKKRRVAAYARVSTDEEAQLSSYDAQVSYYKDYIAGRSDWEFVEVYADEGITGTHKEGRAAFNRMVDDAVKGKKIDLILTKSISRFARNTVDSLTSIRKLKDNGVEVYFEKENIYTFDSKGEMLLTIMSSIAQEESRSISENVLWGVRRRFEDGKFSVGYKSFLGYDKGPDGRLAVNKTQAMTVRYIFRRFLEGKTPYAISRELMDLGYKTGPGNTRWTSEAVVRILRNEKYAGNAILQKTFKVDLLSKRTTNNGEVQKFLVEGSHPAIVSQEEFDMAQRELDERKHSLRQHSSKSIFSGRIICSDCGGFYGAKVWHSTDMYRSVTWQCDSKFRKGKEKCTTPNLKEERIREIFLEALNRLVVDKKEVLADLEAVMAKVSDCKKLEEQLKKAEKELTAASLVFYDYMSRTAITDEEMENGRYVELEKTEKEAQKAVDEIRDELTDRKRRAAAIDRFIEEVRGYDKPFTEFTEEAWLGLCESMTVEADGKVTVKFKSGVEVDV